MILNKISQCKNKHIRKHSLRAMAIQSAFLVSSLTVVAHAEDSGFYAGIAVGSAVAEEQGQSSSSSSFGVEAGYQFNTYLKAELSLFDLGDHSDIGLSAQGASLSTIVSYPLNHSFSLFGMGGAMILEQDIDESKVTVNDTGDDTLQDGRDSGFLMGYGAEYRFDKWSLVIKNVLADTDADLNNWSLSAQYRF